LIVGGTQPFDKYGDQPVTDSRRDFRLVRKDLLESLAVKPQQN
jgi:hypothetical protein